MDDARPQSSTRGRLLGIKLRTLVAEHLGVTVDSEPGEFASGASIVVGGAAWVLVDGRAERSLGPALAWALRQGSSELHLVADADTALLARRADRFSMPISVWYPVDRTLLPALAEPLVAPPPPRSAHLDRAGLIDEAGATVVVEHGVVSGEVRGLEVCRVVDTPTVGYFDEPDGGPPVSSLAPNSVGDVVIVEVGVGAPDREAFRIIHGDIPTVEALAGVVAVVDTHRAIDAAAHPLNRLAPERFLRWRLQQQPELAGLAHVTPVEPPLPRGGLTEIAPAVGRATTVAGDDVTLVCSVGVDLDLIPFVADVQETNDLPVVIALPSRDLVPITIELAALLTVPPRFVTVG